MRRPQCEPAKGNEVGNEQKDFTLKVIWKKLWPICRLLRRGQNAGDIWELPNGGCLMGMKNTGHAEHPIQCRHISLFIRWYFNLDKHILQFR